MKNKLVLIDGYSVLYRSFYALPLLVNKEGKYTNAMYGFINMLVKAINDIKPTHMAVAFDYSNKTFRNEIYSDYKATRKPMPEELKSQVEPVKEMLSLMNIKLIEKEGVEADDILGTLSKKYDDTEVIIVTGDRDSFQLISPSTSVYFTKKGITEVKIMDTNALFEDYGCEPRSIVDLKALQGDASDNIPGVPGIGEKTAGDLIRTYKTLENVYANLDDIKVGLRKKLEEGKELAKMSYRLAQINTNVDIDCPLDSLTFEFPFSDEVYDFMKKYNFTSFLARKDMFGEKKVEVNKIQTETIKLDNAEKLQNMVETIEKSGVFSSIYGRNDDFYIYSDGTEWVLPTLLDMFASANIETLFFEKMKSLYENDAIRKILFDSKMMRHRFIKKGIEIKGKFDDVGIMAHLVEGISIKYPEDVLDTPELNIKCPAMSLFLAYNNYFEKLERAGMQKLYNDLELPLSLVLFDMEETGFKVDKKRVDELGELYSTEIDQLVEKIYELAGEKFNINSAKQLSDILYKKLNLPHNKKMSTSAEVLEEIAGSHEIVPVLLRYRKLSKLNSTYIEGLKPHIDENNFVHTSFKQTLTTTGRLSSVEPNLQNIPIRSEESREVRSIYVASDEEHVLIDADYSQIELRLLAHFSGDPFFVDAFNKGYDIHSQTACQVFGVDKANVTPEMRRIAKVVNFGIIYGISDFGLSSDLKISIKEAKTFIDNFYSQHPLVREYMENAIKKAKETGRVSTLLGRTRKMVDINSSNYMIRSRAERASQNMPLQGSAADIIKLAMIKVYNALKGGGYKAKLIMQVHDELIVDCPLSEKTEVMALVKECMNTATELKVPLICDVTSSYRWSDGH